jgi:hypothetical protein
MAADSVLDRPAVSRPLRIAAAALLCATALLAQGCGNACLSLAEQICVCLPDDGTRAACNKRAKDDQAIYSVRPEDETVCQQKIDSHACDCNQLTTPEGKLGCGLSYPTN